MQHFETIVAISTPPGEGGIGIVRLSGPDSLSIADRIFRTRKGRPLREITAFRLALGTVSDPEGGDLIDEVLAVHMPANHSYTFEEMVEFQAHGGRLVLEKIVHSIVRAGARIAEPGEFTKRAFLHGRLDLSQAEAVIDLIRASSESARRLALRQLEGGLSRQIRPLKSKLTEAVTRLEAILDFSEEEELEDDFSPDVLREIRADIHSLLAKIPSARILREGFRIAVIGRPNVGKSSIFNALLEKERSIITPVPGTTRDTIEEAFIADGVRLILTDTAGLGEARDAAEAAGIRRSRESLRTADAALVVLDLSEHLHEGDREIIAEAFKRPSIVALNKDDLPCRIDKDEIRRLAGKRRTVTVSAKIGTGLNELRTALTETFRVDLPAWREEDFLLASARHEDSLRRAQASLEQGLENLAGGGHLDLVAADVRESLSAIGEITGSTTSETILADIFSRFCIGK